MPVSPPIRNCTRKPSANSIGVVSRIAPPHSVPSMSKYSIARRDRRAAIDVSEKYFVGDAVDREHVVRPHAHRQRRERSSDTTIAV